MIDARELRIGNIVKTDIDSYHKITIEDLQNLLDDCQDDFYQLIPLTEEILLKCGFEFINTTNQYGWYKSASNRFLCWCYSEFISLEPITIIDGFNDTLFEFDCKYLHQLQNLYWCLCWEELDFIF